MRLTPLAFLTDSDSAARAAVLRSRHRLSASLIRDTIRRSQKSPPARARAPPCLPFAHITVRR
jgi:hypothetical protein